MPSSHVCAALESPFPPQVWYQPPPRAQHVRLPASLVTHLGHVVAGAGVVAADVRACMRESTEGITGRGHTQEGIQSTTTIKKHYQVCRHFCSTESRLKMRYMRPHQTFHSPVCFSPRTFRCLGLLQSTDHTCICQYPLPHHRTRRSRHTHGVYGGCSPGLHPEW